MNPNQSSMIPYTPTTLDSLPAPQDRGGGGERKTLVVGGKKPDYPNLRRIVLRPVAPVQGERIFRAWKHIFDVIPGSNRWLFAWCPLQMKVAPSCYFCEREAQVRAGGSEQDVATADKMRANEVILIQGIVRNDEARGIVIYEAKWLLNKKLNEWFGQYGPSIDPFNPCDGRDIVICLPDKNVSGSRFDYELAPVSVPLAGPQGRPDNGVIRALIEQAVCLKSYAHGDVLSYQKQVELYQQKLSAAPAPVAAAAMGYQPPQYGQQQHQHPGPVQNTVQRTNRGPF